MFTVVTWNTFCRTRNLSNATFFHFWSRDVHPVQNLLLCTKFHPNQMRYGDITIFKMAAVRHLGIVLLPYETTHEVSVDGRSCLSNFMLIWYTDLKIYSYLNFSHIWLEMPIQAPKMGFLGTFDPLMWLFIIVTPKTAHPLTTSVPTSYYLMWHYNCLWILKG